jgi:23S rRNA (pseudouridine1915-N3)-methyltransferase
MQHIRLVAVGNLKDAYYGVAVCEYAKRLGKYCKFEIVEIRESNPKTEMQDIIKNLKGHVILFDINGTEISSPALADKIARLAQTAPTITFIIGASDGVDPAIAPHVHERISFGKITLPHQLFRVIAAEQIYRAFTIINNEKYHK